MTKIKPPFTHADLRRAMQPGMQVLRQSELLPHAVLTVTRVTSRGWYHSQQVQMVGHTRTVRGFTEWGRAAATTVEGDRPWRWVVQYEHGTVRYKMRGNPRRLPGQPKPAPDAE